MNKEKKDLKSKIITKSKKTGNLEAEPEFTKESVIFYRIPHRFIEAVKQNEVWEGEIQKLKDTKKKDKRGVPIFIYTFIPVRRENGIK